MKILGAGKRGHLNRIPSGVHTSSLHHKIDQAFSTFIFFVWNIEKLGRPMYCMSQVWYVCYVVDSTSCKCFYTFRRYSVVPNFMHRYQALGDPKTQEAILALLLGYYRYI